MSKLFGLFSDKRARKNSESKHEKIEENGSGDHVKASREGSSFDLKYLGSTLLDELEDGKSYGNSISAEAVKIIVHMAKASGRKLPQMCLTVCPTGITVVDGETQAVLTELDIHRIHFCTADKNHTKVFAYIARSTENETMECHAFLCPKWKVAKAVTLAVAHAFQDAKTQYEKEQEEADKKRYEAVFDRPSVSEPEKIESTEPTEPQEPALGILVNLAPDPEPQPPPATQPQQTMGFEDNFADTFKPLTAQSRSNPFSTSRFSMGLEEKDIDEAVLSFSKGNRERLSSNDDDFFGM